MMKHIIILTGLLWMGFAQSHAQSDRMDRQYVKEGNKQFRLRNFSDAETSYRKAIEKNKENPQAQYNLGTALIAQGQDTMAIKSLEQAARIETNPLRRSAAHHNLGTILQGRKMFGEAIEQYKQALRLNPNDDDARYNLVLCKHQLKNQPQNQDNKNQNQDQQQQDQQQQDQQKQQQQKQEQQKQEQQKEQMSRENAEQLLNAAMQQEKQTQKRMKEAEKQPQRRSVEKNW